MNPYQITGIIAGCTLVFAGVVALLAMQGLPLMVSFLLVYAVALLSMLGMQRRARSACENDGSEGDTPAGMRTREALAGRRATRARAGRHDDARAAPVRLDTSSSRITIEPLRVAVGDVRY